VYVCVYLGVFVRVCVRKEQMGQGRGGSEGRE